MTAGTRELFRYVRVKQPRVVDLAARVAAVPRLAAITQRSHEERASWCREWIASRDAIQDTRDIAEYLEHLSRPELDAHLLPSRADLRSPGAFPGLAVRASRRYAADRERALATLFAWDELRDELREATRTDALVRIVSFLDVFPHLERVIERQPYPSLIRARVAFKVSATATAHEPRPTDDPHSIERSELATLAKHLDTLWRVRRELIAKQVSLAPAAPSVEPRVRIATQAPQRRPTMLEKNATLVAERDEARRASAKTGLSSLLGSDFKIPPSTLSIADDDIAKAKAAAKDLLAKYGIDPSKFCVTTEEVYQKLDGLPPPPFGPQLGLQNACYKEHPKLVFHDEVRLLGHADLIRVDERLVGYTDLEISYIENVLKGEERERRVRTKKYFEQLTERTTEEEQGRSSETSTTTKQDLSSHISTELNTRINSDINASGSGKGGGELGGVEFSGSGTIDAKLGLDVEARISTDNQSTFSHEVISKAVETTKSTMVERRLNRAWQLYDTQDSYRIDNTGPEAESLNGVYRFVDKEVCITETLYGKRLFMVANLRVPGRNLVCERAGRLLLGLAETGNKPIFDISIDDVHPSTYKALATRFRAANIKPPPSPVARIGRTYKTDATNTNAEVPSFSLEKIGEALTPFFERYKRFLISDTIRIPDGYEVSEVLVTVNHGRNGISVPADLPLRLVGATLGAGLTLVTAAAQGILGPAVFVPAAVYQFQYAVSPVLHYNADSSNVSACVGNETRESPYFFFEPDELLRQLFEAFGNFLADAGPLLQEIQTAAGDLSASLAQSATTAAGELRTVIQGAVNTVLDNIKSAFTGANLIAIKDAITSLANVTLAATSIESALTTLVQPVIDFVSNLILLFTNGLQQAFVDLFELLSRMSVNSEILPFTLAKGTRGELPVTFNTIAINPGVTINLVACLARTSEGLDRWRIETFEALHQAYTQQLADYDTRVMLLQGAERIERNPETMRREEATAIKELVLHALNNYHGPVGNEYTLEKLNLFENAIDWNNMTYRLFNYGPSLAEVVLDKAGVYATADERRKAFLKAAWTQVLIPLVGDERLEGEVRRYFADNAFTFEGDLGDDDLAALYTELARDRARIASDPPILSRRHETLPTDLVVLRSGWPAFTPCEPIPPIVDPS